MTQVTEAKQRVTVSLDGGNREQNSGLPRLLGFRARIPQQRELQMRSPRTCSKNLLWLTFKLHMPRVRLQEPQQSITKGGWSVLQTKIWGLQSCRDMYQSEERVLGKHSSLKLSVTPKERGRNENRLILIKPNNKVQQVKVKNNNLIACRKKRNSILFRGR